MADSPRIHDLAWGRIEVEDPDGTDRTYKDAKLFPGGSREWDWNETGTSHSPGIQPADLEEVLDEEPEVVVLGRGVYERLGVTDGARRRLEEAGVEYRTLTTPEAVKRYGELREAGRRVGALIHTTC